MRRVIECLLRVLAAWLPLAAVAAAPCDKPVYLSFDTGHMGVAPLVAEVLNRHQVKATFFLANERTLDGGGSLDDRWAAWWRARAAEGHAFGSHTWDHDVWQADLPGPVFRVRPTAGPSANRPRVLDAQGTNILIKDGAPLATMRDGKAAKGDLQVESADSR